MGASAAIREPGKLHMAWQLTPGEEILRTKLHEDYCRSGPGRARTSFVAPSLCLRNARRGVRDAVG
jgi:hypothetical protein